MNALLQVLYYDRVFRQGIYDYIALESDIQDESNIVREYKIDCHSFLITVQLA
jgi:hypothetical protein